MSEFGKLNWVDIGKGVLIAFLTVFLGGLYTALDSGTFPTVEQLTGWALSGLAAAIAYVLKNFLTNSENKLLKKENK